MDNALFCFQDNVPAVDIKSIFNISEEDNSLRVKNDNVNLLYYGLSENYFNKYYNYFNKFINFNFKPVLVDHNEYSLSSAEQDCLKQVTVTNSIYAYIVNRGKIVLKPTKIALQLPFDDLLAMLDKKYGVNNEISIAVGSSVLRQSTTEFRKNVQQRRRYYNK